MFFMLFFCLFIIPTLPSSSPFFVFNSDFLPHTHRQFFTHHRIYIIDSPCGQVRLFTFLCTPTQTKEFGCPICKLLFTRCGIMKHYWVEMVLVLFFKKGLGNILVSEKRSAQTEPTKKYPEGKLVHDSVIGDRIEHLVLVYPFQKFRVV